MSIRATAKIIIQLKAIVCHKNIKYGREYVNTM